MATIETKLNSFLFLLIIKDIEKNAKQKTTIERLRCILFMERRTVASNLNCWDIQQQAA